MLSVHRQDLNRIILKYFELRKTLEHYFTKIEQINNALLQEEYEFAHELHRSYIKSQCYSISKYNLLEAQICLQDACTDFNLINSKSWIEKKETIKLSQFTTFKDCFGYRWILENIELIKNIKNNKEVDYEFIELAKEENNKLKVSEWRYVKNEKDAKDLLHAAWGFHDSVLENINYKLKEGYEDPSVVQVLFTGCWECDILLEFKRDILIHFNIDDINSYEINDSNILFDDGYIYWVDEYIDNIKDIKKGLLPLFIIILVFFLLIMLEPDFGTAMVITLTLVCLIFVSGLKISFFSFIVAPPFSELLYHKTYSFQYK